jgi:cytoskeleton protein RodZ
MSELRDSDVAPLASGATTAGSLLRKARQAQGLHIAALAASIKVAQRKLELLEADRLDELPDATFTRALAQTVCRSLKIDAAPVLALLPQVPGHRLDHLSEGLNTPFRDRPGQAPPKDWVRIASPAVWGPVLLLLAALGVYMLPPGLIRWPEPARVVNTVESAASAPEEAVVSVPVPPVPASSAASSVVEMIQFAPPIGAAASGAASAPPPMPMKLVQLSATAESWVEVHDRRGRPLLARMILPGETVSLDGQIPLRLKIGNATATQVLFRGQPVDLSQMARDNVARLELK